MEDTVPSLPMRPWRRSHPLALPHRLMEHPRWVTLATTTLSNKSFDNPPTRDTLVMIPSPDNPRMHNISLANQALPLDLLLLQHLLRSTRTLAISTSIGPVSLLTRLRSMPTSRASWALPIQTNRSTVATSYPRNLYRLPLMTPSRPPQRKRPLLPKDMCTILLIRLRPAQPT
jgi:hypothetical protein